MLKALLWKEWREQRGIAFAGVAVALMVPLIVISIASASGAPDFLEVADIVPFLFGLVVWPLFAALAGATANSESMSTASANFMLSRPVPRIALWSVKVVIAAVPIAFIVALSFYVGLRVDVWLGGWGFRFPFSSDPFPWPSDAVVQQMSVGVLYVTFCAAIFLSTFLRRSLAAAMGGLGVAVASQFIALYTASHISSYSLTTGADGFLQTYSIGVAIVLLLASLYVFRISGPAAGGDARRSACRAWVGIVLSLPLIVLLAGFSATRISPESARVSYVAPVRGTDTSIVSLYGNAFTGRSLWAAAPGEAPRPLTSRMARGIAVSPGGRWLVYESRLSAVGTRARDCALRVARIDGSEDRLLGTLSGVRGRCGNGGFSPDGRRIAVGVDGASGADRLMIADLEGSGLRFIDISAATPSNRYWTFTPHWISDDTLLFYSTYRADAYWRVDVDTGTLIRVYSAAEDMSSTLLAVSLPYLMIHEEERRASFERALDDRSRLQRTRLIDITDGSVREIEPLCPPENETERASVALSPDGRHAFFACRPRLPRGEEWDFIDSDELFRGALLRRDLAGGEETAIARLDGYVSSISPSPDASRFIVRLADLRDDLPAVPLGVSYRAYDSWRRYTYRYVLVGADGSQRSLGITPDWYMGEWFDNDRVVLYGRTPRYASAPLAYLELHRQAFELRPLLGPGRDWR